jgi:hypothetical protein
VHFLRNRSCQSLSLAKSHRESTTYIRLACYYGTRSCEPLLPMRCAEWDFILSHQTFDDRRTVLGSLHASRYNGYSCGRLIYSYNAQARDLQQLALRKEFYQILQLHTVYTRCLGNTPALRLYTKLPNCVALPCSALTLLQSILIQCPQCSSQL